MPLFRATGKMQQDMRSMQQKMEEQMNAQQRNNTASSENSEPAKPPRHEYIDFEEVKK